MCCAVCAVYICKRQQSPLLPVAFAQILTHFFLFFSLFSFPGNALMDFNCFTFCVVVFVAIIHANYGRRILQVSLFATCAWDAGQSEAKKSTCLTWQRRSHHQWVHCSRTPYRARKRSIKRLRISNPKSTTAFMQLARTKTIYRLCSNSC